MSDIRRHSPPGARSDADPAGWTSDRATYRITVQGCLDASWSEWFDGLAITVDRDRGFTSLAGCVADQTALHGLLIKVRNLGLTLVYVERVDTGPESGTAHLQYGEDQTQ